MDIWDVVGIGSLILCFVLPLLGLWAAGSLERDRQRQVKAMQARTLAEYAQKRLNDGDMTDQEADALNDQLKAA